MAIGKAVNLRVRPVQSVDLCYPVDGLIARQPTGLLGNRVRGLNIESLYLVLLETVEGDDSRLVWTSDKIYDFLQDAPRAEATCRAAPVVLGTLQPGQCWTLALTGLRGVTANCATDTTLACAILSLG